MEYKLNDELSLKYIESIKIDAMNYYKYSINNLKNKSVSKVLYFNKEINLDIVDKEKLSRYITEKKLSSNEENIFINLDEFILNENGSFSGKEGAQPKTSGNGNINLLNFEDFDKALGLIRGAKGCNLSSLSNTLINLETLGGENKNIDTGIFDISTKINRLGKGGGPVALVDNYISVYEDILSGIIEVYATDQKIKAETGKLQLNQATLDIEGAENAIKNGLIDYTAKILEGEIKPKTLGEYFGQINTIYNNYSTTSVKDMEDVLNAATLTEDSETLKDMDEKERKAFIEAKNKQLDGIYESIKDALNISREEFDRLLQNDIGKLAELLAMQSQNEVRNRLNGVDDINGVNIFYFEIENLWYSTEAGQEALFEKFKIDSPTKFDEEDALAYTEYIKYCMSREHSQDWLREDLRKFSNVVSKIDENDTFSHLSDEEVTKEELEYITSFMAASGGFLPYGYEKVGDTYRRREYTKQGEEILYYMDYHCGEDLLKKDEDRIITAFSNQGKLDAYERNYKGAWINSQITGNYASETQKQVAIENAERDYNILNGIIEDEERKQQLIAEGYLSFEQLATFVNNNNIDLEKLSDKGYIDANKETIMKETGLNEAQLYNFAITGTMPGTGDAYLDGQAQAGAILFSSLGITGLQALSGIDKYFENVGDSVKTAVKSDFILNMGINFDDSGNLYLDLSKNIELTKEFKEYHDSVWKKYLDSELYKEQYEKFKSSTLVDDAVKAYYDKYLFDPLTGEYKGLDGKKYYLYEDISDKEKEAISQKLLPNLFKESKLKEWNLNDSSSSNYYIGAFKEGIRNGGDFSSFDDLDSIVIKNAKEQIETINEVSVDKVGTWWNENIYNKDWYNTMESFSLVKKDNILGMTANQIGNMAIPVGLSALGTALGMPALGQALSSATLFTSAFGGAAEEAFLSGASYNEALGYATLSASTELVIEKVFSGIAGFGEGWMDEVIDFLPNKVIDAADFLIRNNTGKTDVLKGNVLTQTIKSLITGGIGEGIEEVATDLVTPLWQSLTYMNEKGYSDIVSENVSFESLKQTFLVSFLSSMVFGSSEISQKTNAFNKQMNTLTNQIGDIPGFKEQANKILADIIGYDGQYLTSDIITKTIENNAKQIELNPESQIALKELQQKLTDAYQDLTKNTVELKTKDGSVKLSKELIMNINEIYGFNQKNIFNKKDDVTIDGDKISFKDSKTQQKFISALYENAKNVVSNQITQNNEALLKLQEALELSKKDIIKTEDLNSAIQILKELGDKSHFAETFGTVTLEINGNKLAVPISVVNEITTKYNIKDGKIVFTEENMNAKEFASKILSQAIAKLTFKNFASMKEIQEFNDASKKGDIKLLEKASNIIGNNLKTFVVNSTKVDGKDLIKLEVKTNVDGEYRSVNIYVDSSTNPTVYVHNDLLAEKIQEIIDKNIGKENIYLGEIVYDKKNDELIVKQNEENNSYVENIKTSITDESLTMHTYEIIDGTNKSTVNIYLDVQTDTNILENNNVKKKVNEIIETKRKQNPDARDIYIGKIELKNGQPKITIDRNQKAFVDSKTENIVTTERTNVTGTDLIKVEAYVTIDGKTEKVNAYVDSKTNTTLLSRENVKQKLLDMIIEEKSKNKDTKDVYVGEVINDKKNGNIVVSQNNVTLEQFRNTIIASTVVSGSTSSSTTKTSRTDINTETNTTSKNETKKNDATIEEVIDTKNIFNERNAKIELDKFVKNIEKAINDFVSKHKNDPDFITRFEQLKTQTNIEFNEKIIELINTINDSYNTVIEQINKKIETLNENDPQIEKLKSEIDTLTKEREAEIKKLKEYDASKLNQIFNSIGRTKIFEEINRDNQVYSESIGETNPNQQTVTQENLETRIEFSDGELNVEAVSNIIVDGKIDLLQGLISNSETISPKNKTLLEIFANETLFEGLKTEKIDAIKDTLEMFKEFINDDGTLNIEKIKKEDMLELFTDLNLANINETHSSQLELLTKIPYYPSFVDALNVETYFTSSGDVKVELIEELIKKNMIEEINKLIKNVNFDVKKLYPNDLAKQKYFEILSEFNGLERYVGVKNISEYFDSDGLITSKFIDTILSIDTSIPFDVENMDSKVEFLAKIIETQDLSNLTESEKAYINMYLKVNNITSNVNFKDANMYFDETGKIKSELIAVLVRTNNKKILSILIEQDLSNLTIAERTFLNMYEKHSAILHQLDFGKANKYFNQSIKLTEEFIKDIQKSLAKENYFSIISLLNDLKNQHLLADNVNLDNIAVLEQAIEKKQHIYPEGVYIDLILNIAHKTNDYSFEFIHKAEAILNRAFFSDFGEVKIIAPQLIEEIMQHDKPLEFAEYIYSTFEKNHIPYIGKIFKIYQKIYTDRLETKIYSPILKELQRKHDIKKFDRTIFSDLVRISFGSNNRSAINYLTIIEKGNNLYEQIKSENIKYDELTVEDKKVLKEFAENLEKLYNETQAGINQPYRLQENYDVIEAISELSKLFKPTSRYSLPDRIVRSFAYDAGFKSFSELKEYTLTTVNNAHQRNVSFAKTNPKVLIEVGDFVKRTKPEFIESHLQNGNISHEFLGEHASTDYTPFDTDYCRVEYVEGLSGVDLIASTAFNAAWGELLSVIRYDPNRMQITTTENTSGSLARDGKLEVFASPAHQSSKEWSIRTGNASSDISYFVAKDEDIQRVSLAISNNGFYIPVYNMKGELAFTPEDYELIRNRMQGLSYYQTGEYTFSGELSKHAQNEESSAYQQENKQVEVSQEENTIASKETEENNSTSTNEEQIDVTVEQELEEFDIPTKIENSDTEKTDDMTMIDESQRRVDRINEYLISKGLDGKIELSDGNLNMEVIANMMVDGKVDLLHELLTKNDVLSPKSKTLIEIFANESFIEKVKDEDISELKEVFEVFSETVNEDGTLNFNKIVEFELMDLFIELNLANINEMTSASLLAKITYVPKFVNINNVEMYFTQNGEAKVELINELIKRNEVSEAIKLIKKGNITLEELYPGDVAKQKYFEFVNKYDSLTKFTDGRNISEYFDSNGRITSKLIVDIFENRAHFYFLQTYDLKEIFQNEDLSNLTPTERTFIDMFKKYTDIFSQLDFKKANLYFDSNGRITLKLVMDLFENCDFSDLLQTYTLIEIFQKEDLSNLTPTERTCIDMFKKYKDIISSLDFKKVNLYFDSNGRITSKLIVDLFENCDFSNLLQTNNLIEIFQNEDLANLTPIERTYIDMFKKFESIFCQLDFKKANVYFNENNKLTEMFKIDFQTILSSENYSCLNELLNYVKENNLLADNIDFSNIETLVRAVEKKPIHHKEAYINAILTTAKRKNDFSFKFIPELDVLFDPIFKSNSSELQRIASEIILNLIAEEKAFEKINEICSIFVQNHIPYIGKVFKVFEMLYDNKILESTGVFSPQIHKLQGLSAKEKIYKTFFSDLVRISFGSNNRSALNYLNVIERGNNLYEQIKSGNIKYSDLSVDDKKIIRTFAENLEKLYNETKEGIRNPYRLKEDFDVVESISELSKLFKPTSRYTLPDRIVRSFAYDAGFKSFAELKEYTLTAVNNAHQRNIQFAKSNPTVLIEAGDLIKCSAAQYITAYLQDGNIAPEFLGKEAASNATLYDSDYIRVPDNATEVGMDAINTYKAGEIYGMLISVVKYNPDRMQLTTTENFDGNLAREGKLELFTSPVVNKNHCGIRTGNASTDISYFIAIDTDIQMISFEIARNGFYIPVYNTKGDLVFSPADYELIRNRMQGLSYYQTGEYTFSGELSKHAQNTINTFFENLRKSEAPITKIPIVKKLIGVETAINTEISSQEVLEVFEKFEQEKFDDPDFVTQCFEMLQDGKFDKLITDKAKTDFDRLHIVQTINKLDTTRKRNQILRVLENTFSQVGIKTKYKIDGDVTLGYAEIIDTGSTGRNANIPGDGDFDFTIKIDNEINSDPNRKQELENLFEREIVYKEKESTFYGPRYKGVKVPGLDILVDIDLSFMQRTLDIQYSTDMALADRYNGMSNNPIARDLVIAELANFKQMLKDAEAYSKRTKDITQGGLGGVGIENLLLQNGGSIFEVAKSFLEASRNTSYSEYLELNPGASFVDYINGTKHSVKSWNEFLISYSIFDLGENHYSTKGYAHDNFVSGNMNETGYRKMIVLFEKYLENIPETSGSEEQDNIVVDKTNIMTNNKTVAIEQDLEIIDIPNETEGADIIMIDESEDVIELIEERDIDNIQKEIDVSTDRVELIELKKDVNKKRAKLEEISKKVSERRNALEKKKKKDEQDKQGLRETGKQQGIIREQRFKLMDYLEEIQLKINEKISFISLVQKSNIFGNPTILKLMESNIEIISPTDLLGDSFENYLVRYTNGISTRQTDTKDIVGVTLEDYIVKYAEEKSGKIPESRKQQKLFGLEYDGVFRGRLDGKEINLLWEAKSGNWCETLDLEKFSSSMGYHKQQANAHGYQFELISNSPIRADVKEILEKQGIPYTELYVKEEIVDEGMADIDFVDVSQDTSNNKTSSMTQELEIFDVARDSQMIDKPLSPLKKEELTKSEKHLVYGDGIKVSGGIKGAHSTEYFMNLFTKTFEEIKKIYKVQYGTKNQVLYISLGKKLPHPSIDGVWTQEYYYEIKTNKGVDTKKAIKTLVDNKKKLLDWQKEAIANSETLDGNEVAYGMSNNGLWFRYFPENGNAFPFYEFTEKFIKPIIRENIFKIKVPVLKDGVYTTVDVSIDSSTSTKVLEHGPELIKYVQEIVNRDNDLYDQTINLGKLIFNEETQVIEKISFEKSETTMDIETIDESTTSIELDESGADLEPLIIDERNYVNGSNESSQTVIQRENVKKLSILDNIKHTLVKLNDKFIGFKMSKLTTESYYERTTKSNNKLFKQKEINKTFRDFLNKHLIDLQTLKENGLLKNPKISEINPLITNNRVLLTVEDANVSIADILGTKKKIDLDRNFGLLFDDSDSEFQTRDLGLLEYTSDQILNVLAESFKAHPIVISEVDTGKYIIEDNGYHRYSILRLHYLSEYIKVKDNPKLVAELNKKYTIPVKVYKLDTTRTYCTTILNELGIDVKIKTSSVTKQSKIYIDGKRVTMSNSELIEFTKNIISNNLNSTLVLNKLFNESKSFREFFNEYLITESNDYGIDFNIDEIVKNNQIDVNNKTYSLDKIVDILSNKYLEILKGNTIYGINSQNMFDIFNKVFETYPELKTKYKAEYDKIVDIFKTKYVHKNGNLYPKTFNLIKTEDVVEVLKNPYKLEKYSKEKRMQINKAINMYVEYAISNNYDLTPKEYSGFEKITELMKKDVQTVKKVSEVKSQLLNEFRRNVINNGTFGSKQGIIRLLLERNGITNAINYLFNQNETGTKFLESIQGFTTDDFYELLDSVIDESGRLEGLYELTEQFELLDLLRDNLDGAEDFEIIKFLYLFESLEAGGKGICNYSVAVNMIFNMYLGKEAQFERDFGYSMYVVKDGKKVLNDMMLLVDMYSIINKEVFTKEVDGVIKVVATNNQKYLPVTKPGGSFDIENLQKFFSKKGIKFNLNPTFRFDSRFDSMWKDEILFNVKRALEKGETVNLSAAGFNLYKKDGKTPYFEDFGGHVMTVVGITKDGNLIVDSHGIEMIVNLDECLEQAGKIYKDKKQKISNRRFGIVTYSFDSRIPSSKQNFNMVDISDRLKNDSSDEGIFDVFSKSTGDIDLFKDALSNNKLNTLTEPEIQLLIENINKGKIKPKDYNLNAETIRVLIDKVPIKKLFPLSNVTAIKSFIDYFGIDTLVEFDKLNNGFLFGNKGENLYSLFDFYDLSVPETSEKDKLKELDKLIVDTINSNKKTEHKTYTFNYSGLIGSEFAKAHPELFLEESAPQDLKDAFYKGLVNSGNEYKNEWSKYLEGKSVKGIIHKPLTSYEQLKTVEDINSIGENSTKYSESLQALAQRVGMTTIEVEDILITKMRELIEKSEFGVRRTLKSLEGILESGKLKNQFEVNNTSYGVNNTDMRMDMERELFGIPENVKYEDRPIYGMLLPEDLSSKYVHKGPGAYYSDGSGVIYIFDKSKIINNATLTLGDSIDQAGKICATNLSNPRYFGMFSEMLETIKTKEDLINFEFTSLYDKTVMEVGNSAYYEFQLHGENSHTLDNLKEIVFLKMPEAKIIRMLEEKNISWRVINQNNSHKNNSPSINKGIKETKTSDDYFSFPNSKSKAVRQLSAYYGDAGKRVNSLFLEGKTTDEVLEELTILERGKFKKFLEDTIEGRYLAKLTDDEITALSLYTKEHHSEINCVLRHKTVFNQIARRNPQRLIENIDSAIAKYGGLEQPMKIYRAVDVSAFTHQNSTYKELFRGIKVYKMDELYAALKTLEGKEFSDLGYMSCSPSYGTSFAKHLRYSIVLEILADQGTECAYINQLSSFYNEENEILLARNTKLEIKEVLEPKEDMFGLTKIVVRCIVKKKE